MRRGQFMIGVMAALLLAIGVVASPAQPQFTGSWALDPAQSRFPAHEGTGHRAPDPQAQRPSVTLVVEQQGNVLKARRTVAKGNRERSMTETYVTDGTEQTQPGHRGSVVTRAVFDGDRLVVTKTHTRKGEQGDTTMSRESIWTLSPDGQVLTIDTTLQTPRGTRSIKSVYLRS